MTIIRGMNGATSSVPSVAIRQHDDKKKHAGRMAEGVDTRDAVDFGGPSSSGSSVHIVRDILTFVAAAPFALLGTGCSDSGPGSNNNVNNNNDDGGIADGGDAEPSDGGIDAARDGTIDGDADAAVSCVPNTEFPAVVDSVQLTTDGYACNPADLVYHENTDRMLTVCRYPNNRLLTLNPATKQVSFLGQVSQISNNAYIYPQSIATFTSPFDESEDLIAVPFEAADAQQTPAFSGVYLHDLASGAGRDAMTLTFQALCGGCPYEGTYFIQGARGAAFSYLDDRMYVSHENQRVDGSGYVLAMVPGFALEHIDDKTYFDHDTQPALAIPDGYRPAGITALNDGTLAIAVSGLANNQPPQPAKLLFMDPSSGSTPVETTRSIELGLPADETLVPLPRVAHINEQDFIMVATDGIANNPSQRLVVVHRDSPTSETINDIDLTAYAKGPITDVLVDAPNAKVYVVARGNTANSGSITELVITADGIPTVIGRQNLGGLAGKAELDPFSNPRRIYVHVDSRSDCDAVNAGNTGPQLLVVDVTKIPRS